MAASDVFKKLFPFISAAASLGGPLGTMAANAVGAALGVNKIDGSAAAVNAAMLTATPDQIIALKKVEADFTVQMQALGFADAESMQQIAEADLDSARKREMAVKDWTPKILAYGVTIGFFTVLGFMLCHAIPPVAHDAMLLLLGALQTAWVSIIAYYFGSSAGSDRKTDLLAQAPAIQEIK